MFIDCLFIVIAEETQIKLAQAQTTIAKYEVLIESNGLQSLFYLEANQSESEATDGSKSEEEPSRHKIIGIGS